MRKFSAFVSIAAAVLAVGCNDKTPGASSPTEPRVSPPQPSLSTRPGACFTAATLQTLIQTILGAGRPQTKTALAKLAAMVVFVAQNKIPQAQAAARDLITFLTAQLSPTTSPTLQANIQATINAILCYVGLPSDTYVVLPSNQPQTVVTGDGNTGLNLPGGSITVPTVFTITELDPNGPSGLDTKLDQYPTFISVTSSSQLAQPAVVAVCLGTSVPPDVFARLRLGHQASTGFEVTPYADPSFLGCPTSLGSASKVPGWLKRLANLFLPKTLYARTMMFATGGVGGAAINFSPFGAVDNGLFATGGVGGSAIEFQRTPVAPAPGLHGMTVPVPGGSSAPKVPNSGTHANSVIDASGNCVSADTSVGTQLNPLCRPVITIKTANGTIMTGVPVAWAVTSGDGTIAPDTLTNNNCGLFGTTAGTATDANGSAGVCWTLGPNAGPNAVTGTPSFGGDAPSGVVFLDASGNTLHGYTFTATADLIPTTAGATGASVPYDGLAHPGTGSCSNGLTPAYSYTTIDSSAPVNAGSYTLTVTCGAGSTMYAVSTATATIVITPAPTTTTLSCPAETYTGSPVEACTATVTGPNGLNQPVTLVNYSNNTNAGTASASATYAATNNYQTSTGTATFTIGLASSSTAVSCPATAPYDAAVQNPCTATATGAGGLSASVPVSYAPTTVRDAGGYTASATYSGDANHTGSSGGPASFTITKLPATATAGSGTMSYAGPVPSLPCVVGGLLSPDAGTVTCTTSVPGTLVPGVNVTTPIVSPPAPPDYAVAPVNGTLTVIYVQSGCFASPISSSMPSSTSKSNPKQGTSVTVKCRLLDATGRPVVTAYGNLLVQDKGTNGQATASTVFSGTNVFTVSNDGNFDGDDGFYSYSLATSSTGFVSGHYYFVTATWNDGSTTTGWFYLK